MVESIKVIDILAVLSMVKEKCIFQISHIIMENFEIINYKDMDTYI